MWSFSLEIHVISFIGNVNVNVDGITTGQERAIFILYYLLNNVLLEISFWILSNIFINTKIVLSWKNKTFDQIIWCYNIHMLSISNSTPFSCCVYFVLGMKHCITFVIKTHVKRFILHLFQKISNLSCLWVVAPNWIHLNELRLIKSWNFQPNLEQFIESFKNKIKTYNFQPIFEYM